MEVRDSNGTILQEGDNVTLVKDLKVKGYLRDAEARYDDQGHSSDR